MGGEAVGMSCDVKVGFGFCFLFCFLFWFVCVCFVILQNYCFSANTVSDECWIYRCCALGEELLGLEMGNGRI